MLDYETNEDNSNIPNKKDNLYLDTQRKIKLEKNQINLQSKIDFLMY